MGGGHLIVPLYMVLSAFSETKTTCLARSHLESLRLVGIWVPELPTRYALSSRHSVLKIRLATLYLTTRATMIQLWRHLVVNSGSSATAVAADALAIRLISLQKRCCSAT